MLRFASARVQAGGRFDRVLATHKHADGHLLTAEITASLASVSNAAVIIIARDVTADRALASRITERERLEALGRLAASMSHEFRAVLMSIQPFIDLLDRRIGQDASMRGMLETMRRAVRRGRRITDEILAFNGSAYPELRPIPAGDFFTALNAELRVHFPAAIELKLCISEPSVAMLADEDQLAEVIVNLAANARDAMPNGGTFEITVGQPTSAQRHLFRLDGTAENWILATFRDTGIGMDTATVARVFEPMFTTKRKDTGLGLAVAQQIVHRHGGRLELQSSPGEGTTFFLLLRVATPAAVHPRPFGIRRTLIVDHDPPDALVLNVRLADADAFDICALVRSRWESLPIILISGAALEREAERRTASVQHVRFIAKPFATKQLLEAFAAAS